MHKVTSCKAQTDEAVNSQMLSRSTAEPVEEETLKEGNWFSSLMSNSLLISWSVGEQHATRSGNRCVSASQDTTEGFEGALGAAVS